MRRSLLVLAFFVIGLSSQPLLAAADDIQLDIKVLSDAPAKRPAALIPLYVSLAGLQAYGGYSAMALNSKFGSGGNAMTSGLTGTPAALWSVKAGVTAYSILVSEQLWRQGKRKRAVVVLLVSNAVQAYVSARNWSELNGAK